MPSNNLIAPSASLSGFAIEGPSQATIQCEDQNDGSCDVRYWPTEPGEYAVHVTCDDEDIEHSPFMAYVVPDNNGNDPDKVSRLQSHSAGQQQGQRYHGLC